MSLDPVQLKTKVTSEFLKKLPEGSSPTNRPDELENILNRYKSVNYNFTLAALPPTALKDPSSYRNKKLQYIIASTKGKSANAISENVVGINRTEVSTVRVEGDTRNYTKTTDVKDTSGSKAVASFNKNSPGAFDLFIDNVEINSICAPNELTGTTLSTGIKFEVFEPLSANGFIEALHVGAIAAGWTGYIGACYLLKIEFLGYPDSVDSPIERPEVLDATKYIPLKLTGSEMEVTETGTRYRVSAIAYNEYAHSIPNQLATDISFRGKSVGEVLESLFTALNKSAYEREKKERPEDTAIKSDKYEIYFPVLPKENQSLDISSNGSKNTGIYEAKINEFLRSNTIYAFPPIEKSPNVTAAGESAEQSGEKIRYQPDTNQIQFARGSNITEIIELVIRDSEYLKNILKDVEAAKSKGGNGMIDYFQVLINTVPLEHDSTTNRQFFTYQYIVAPYKVHYSKLPNQQNSKYDANSVSPYVKRKYDYYYMGQNVDVLNFKLNFNNLFFQAAIPKQGNQDVSQTAQAAGASNVQTVAQPVGMAAKAGESQIDVGPTLSDPNSGSISRTGVPLNPDPYVQIAINAHRAILESVNLITGEMEILGDPYFLSTSGLGNYFPTLKDYGMTKDGEANPTVGPIIIRINFRNPLDIDQETGLMKFSDLIPFSGIYQVTKVRHSFRDGVFRQNLSLIRYNGQIIDPKEKPTSAIKTVDTPNRSEQQRADQKPTEVIAAGSKPNDINLGNIIQRGFPQAGLVAGVQKALASFSPVTGLLGAGAVASLAGSKLGKNVLAGLAAGTAVAGIASKISAGANIAGSLGLPNSVNGIANSLSNNVASQVNSALLGSNNFGTNTSPAMNNLLQGAKGLASAANVPSVADASLDKVTNLFSNPLGASAKLTPMQKASVISDAASKGLSIDGALKAAETFGFNLPGSVLSPAGMASKLGLDMKQLSGLTGKLDSKAISQFENIAKSIPENVDLKTAADSGIVMANLAGDTLENLPAMPTPETAPLPDLPRRSVSSALTPEQRSAIIADATEKGIPVDQALRNASLFGINVPGLSDKAKKFALMDAPQLGGGGLNLPNGLSLGGADAAMGKLQSAQKAITGAFAGAAGALGSAKGAFSAASKLTSGVGSIEGNFANLQNSLGNPGSNITQIAGLKNSVTSKFGSLTAAAAGANPLGKLIGGSASGSRDVNSNEQVIDPIVRRALSLQPIENKNIVNPDIAGDESGSA